MNDLKDITEITLKHFGADITVTEQYKRIEKKLNELERLQEKETPKKVIAKAVDTGYHDDEGNEIMATEFSCPSCNGYLYRIWKKASILTGSLPLEKKYCGNCGQRLTWEDGK